MGGRLFPQARLFRFGPFELDVRAGELRKHGIRIKVRDQSVQILLMLLEHPGEVVLREEIRLRLWPNNTIVEFDHGINAAIQKLRNALGDSADSPRYVETVARRGYRFLGEVERVGEPPPEPLSAFRPPDPIPAPIDPGDLTGEALSHYRIHHKLGEGGMGEVYLATDSKLGRDVAVKLLAAEFAHDSQWLARFEREARVLASLNHPNIAAIYTVENQALVMELVEGQTLKGPLEVQTALLYAEQIAGALEAAHEKGVVHRDLKPGNIMVKADGTIKVLDFGLAKPVEAPAADLENSPTLTSPTRAGTILGTAAYMSPEQAAGKPIDKRSDIWSFGVVLWEMLTGRRLFEGDTVTQILAGVLSAPIPLDQVPKETPAGIRELLRRCLERDSTTRLRDIGEARIAIRASLAGGAPAAAAPERAVSLRKYLPWGTAAVLAVGLAFAFAYFREKTAAVTATPLRFQFGDSEKDVGFPVLSPDGHKVAYHLAGHLWVRSLETGEARDLTAAGNGVPFWSPDSRWIVYQDAAADKVEKIAATGGAPVEVTDFVGARTGWGGGAWGKGGAMVFSMKGHLFRVPATGGAAVEIAKPNPKRHEGIQFAPSFLPDGRHFLYICRLLDAGKSGIYLGSIDAKPEEQSSKPLVLSDSQAVFAPSPDPGIGYLLFFRGGELVAQPFDNRRLEPKGQAWLAADNVLPKNFPTAVFIPFSASADNSLLLPQPLPVPQLTWFDREGKAIETVGEPGTYGELALSPDGARLAFEKLAGAASMVGMGNLWMLNLQRDGASTRFTFGPPPDSSPVWSPDGRQVIFRSQHEGHPGLYQKPADSSKDEELVLESAQNISPQSWSQNGFLLCTVTDPKTKADLWVLPLHGERKPMPFLVTPYNENQAVFSPDGKWVAYTSWDADLPQIFVRSFAVNSAGTAVQTGGKIQISTGGGQGAHWRRDGLELYYRSQDSTIQAVEIMTTPTFRAGPPKALGVKLPRVWDCSSDGKRFLATSMGRRQYTVVLNWQTGLTKPATTN